MTRPVIEMEGITKVYRMGEMEVHALRGVDFKVDAGDLLAIQGPSGSGKSTLLNILGCLDHPTSGRYNLAGEAVENLSDRRLSRIRNHRIGFIFQSFNLLSGLTSLRNVMMPLMYGDRRRNGREELARTALKEVGLSDRLEHRPVELSGGQLQRVAIARALVTDPSIILADEPTGNLDSKTGKEIMELLSRLHARGRTIILITHDTAVASNAGRILWMEDGRLKEI